MNSASSAAGGLAGMGRRVTSEPHRLMFFCGGLQSVAAMAWWLGDLTGRYAAWHAPIAWAVPPMWAHAWLLLYGLFPFFILGFLMTAGPNWLGAPRPPRTVFVPSALLMAAGLALFYTGVAVSDRLAATGAFLHVAGWLWGVQALLRLAVRHWSPNARYAIVVFTFVAVGIAGDAIFALSIAIRSYAYAAYALHGAVWFFLLPIYLGVSTRMVPFFSSRVLGPAFDYKPAWARPALMIGAVAHGTLTLSGADGALWAVDLPLAAVVAHLAWRWGLPASGRIRLLAVLHLSLAVLAAALFLSAALSLLFLGGAIARIGLAPVHLLVIGYFAAMALGMVSRVSLGHSGRPLEADALTWACYLGVLLAAGLRAAAEFATPVASPLMIAAGIAWLAAFGTWAARYVPMYLTPRVDAR